MCGNRTINYHYNAASQLIQIVYPDSSVTFTYDANGNRISMDDQAGSTVYIYDSRNRLISETKTLGRTDYTTSYGYDAASNIVSIVYPDGTVINQNYDDLSRLTSVDGYAQFLWNENSQLDQIVYQNNVTTSYTYDVRNRPTQIKTARNSSDLLDLTYTYDPAGNILQMKDNPDGQLKEQWDYTYDSLDRLITASGGPQGDSYSLNYYYDSASNRIQLNNAVYTYNEMNELLTQEGDTNYTYTYDEYGNCTTKNDGETIWEYHYNYENMLVSVEENGQITEQYIYDGNGKRIKKIDSESVRIYTYSGTNVLYEINMTTQMEAVYIYGPTGRIAKRVNDITEYYHTDHLGSARLTTSENGAPVTEIHYKPFGEQINRAEEKYTFNGKELDKTGLYYYGARYYDPENGRFLTRDPLQGGTGAPQTLNRYTYCLNNPLGYIDPAGLDAEDFVQDIFEHLLKLSPEDLGTDLNELLQQADNSLTKLLEILAELLRKMGFEVTIIATCLEVRFQPDEPTAIIEINEEACKSEDAAGFVSTTGKIFISYLQHGTVAELVTTILHELSHKTLTGLKLRSSEEESLIYKIQREYMGKIVDIAKSQGKKNPYSLTYRFSAWSNWFWYSLLSKIGK